MSASAHGRPTRVLVVLPSWIGDAVMATPALRLIRDRLPGAFIGALAKPGVDQILAGLDLVDEYHTMRPTGMMTTKHAAAKVRPRRYQAALLLTNSFSTALVTRLAGIPDRIGYDRDGRGILLTRKLVAPKRPTPSEPRAEHAKADRRGKWAVVPAVNYYWHAAMHLVEPGTTHEPLDASGDTAPPDRAPLILPEDARMELAVTADEASKARAVLDSAGVSGPYAVLNPGGNNSAKRWPADRFAALARHLTRTHGLTVLLNGSPAEQELLVQIANAAQETAPGPVILPEHGGTLGSLKAVLRDAALLVTNDTGPRHIGIAMDTPTVSLFGPTDARWTTVPASRQGPEITLLANPDLASGTIANDVPDDCSIDRIMFESVQDACERVLAASRS